MPESILGLNVAKINLFAKIPVAKSIKQTKIATTRTPKD
jgi:hypothetical protein